MQDKADKLPKVFTVNWFRKDADGGFMWPGFGENMRVLEWIIGRCQGTAEAHETAIGLMPKAHDINTENLDLDSDVLEALLAVEVDGWQKENKSVAEFLQEYGDRVPQALYDELTQSNQKLAG